MELSIKFRRAIVLFCFSVRHYTFLCTWLYFILDYPLYYTLYLTKVSMHFHIRLPSKCVFAVILHPHLYEKDVFCCSWLLPPFSLCFVISSRFAKLFFSLIFFVRIITSVISLLNSFLFSFSFYNFSDIYVFPLFFYHYIFTSYHSVLLLFSCHCLLF